MKFVALLILSSLLFFPACSNEEPVAPEEGIPFLNEKLNFDNAFVSRVRSLPDGNFQTMVTLLASPASRSFSEGITGLPADAFEFTINSGSSPLDLPDGNYIFGNLQAPFQFTSSYLKNDLTITFSDTYEVRSGSIAVSTTDDGTKLLSFDLETVSSADFFNPDASIVKMKGESEVNLVVLE